MKRSKKIILTLSASASLVGVIALALLLTCAAHAEEPMTTKTGTSIFHDGKFHNLITTQDPMKEGSSFGVMREFLFGGEAVREPEAPLPVQQRKGTEFANPPESGLRVTWLGHSTLLIEIDDLRLLTDPVWSERTSPLGFVGPKRFFAPPLPLAELPPIDAVLISHNHYDHLDQATIEKLSDRVGAFFVPLRVGKHLRDWGVPADKIHELDWGQEQQLKNLRLVCTPARHFSGRGLFDRDETLWSSWTVIGPTHRFFFSGDGGMSPSFADIGEQYGPFDLTALEVGAYHPRWADIHAGPEQALQAHQDLRGRVMLPIHWATFNLAMHSWTEPAERLRVGAEARGIQLAIPRPGESVVPSRQQDYKPWWPKLPWKTAKQLPVVSSGLVATSTAKSKAVDDNKDLSTIPNAVPDTLPSAIPTAR